MKEGFKAPEPMKLTPRTYDDYKSMFCLSEQDMKGEKILDVGSGLSNFAPESAERLGDEAPTVVAMDPMYADLGENLHEFTERLEGANLTLEKLGKEWGQVEKQYDQVKSHPLNVAGSHQEGLPFAKGYFDKILANNSMLQFKDRDITRTAFKNVLDVLSDKGELRIMPADFKWDGTVGSLYVNTFEKPTPETRAEADELRLRIGPDRETFKVFKELEEAGYTLYVAAPPSKASHRPRGRMGIMVQATMPYCLILRRDSEMPHMEGVAAIQKLSFKDSTDGFHVPSECIHLRKNGDK